MERILNYLDLPPQERDAVCKQLRSLGCSPAHGTQRTMKKEMEKSRPGTLPQYLFLFRDDALDRLSVPDRRKRGSLQSISLVGCSQCGRAATKHRPFIPGPWNPALLGLRLSNFSKSVASAVGGPEKRDRTPARRGLPLTAR